MKATPSPVNDNRPGKLSLAFRKAAAKDMPDVKRIFNEAFVGQVGKWEMSGFHENLAEGISQRNGLALTVATAGEKVVGFVLEQNMGRGVANLDIIGVDPVTQGQGVGSGLLRNFEDRLLSRGFNTAVLQVREDNTSAWALYERTGYKATRRIPNMYFDGVAGIELVKPLRAAAFKAA